MNVAVESAVSGKAAQRLQGALLATTLPAMQVVESSPGNEAAQQLATAL